MVDYSKARAMAETLYTDSMDIVTITVTKDPVTGIEAPSEDTSQTGVPCRISYDNTDPASDGNAAKLSQTAEIFCSPDATVLPGSKISLTRQGKTVKYECSGQPAVYQTHQEIMALLVEDYA